MSNFRINILNSQLFLLKLTLARLQGDFQLLHHPKHSQ